jgi:hypothetical protein
MDGIVGVPPVGSAQKISEAEMERRREIVRQADAQNRIEGIKRGPESDAIFAAFIRGELSSAELVTQIKTQVGLA